MEEKDIEYVKDFWNDNLCGNRFVKSEFPSKEFFEEYTNFRYKKTHHLPLYIDFSTTTSNKDVLEIGLGIGADGIRLAKNAKSYTGVDLTSEAVKATQIHFKLKNLKGNIVQGNAENLEFADDTFDLVYSHGVLHHTPKMEKAFIEVNRVLKKDGKVIIMLYAKESFNYWFRIQLLFRLRLIIEIIKNIIGLSNNNIWSKHIANYKVMGFKYLSWKEFPHHCTDGPDCSFAFILSKRATINLFEKSGFQIIKIKKAHFPLGSRYPKLERFIGNFIGFHRIIWAKKIKSANI